MFIKIHNYPWFEKT